MLPGFLVLTLSWEIPPPISGYLFVLGLILILGGNIMAPYIIEIRAAQLKAIVQRVNSDKEYPDGRKRLTFVYKGTPYEEMVSLGGMPPLWLPRQYWPLWGWYHVKIPLDPPFEIHPRYGPIKVAEYMNRLPLAELWLQDERGKFWYLGFSVKGKVVHDITVDEVNTRPGHPRVKDGQTRPIYTIVESSKVAAFRMRLMESVETTKMAEAIIN